MSVVELMGETQHSRGSADGGGRGTNGGRLGWKADGMGGFFESCCCARSPVLLLFAVFYTVCTQSKVTV